MSLGLLTLYLHLPGCCSLKEKRSRIKPLLSRLHREFNVSAAEIDRMDMWQESIIQCAVVSNEATHTNQVLQNVVGYIESCRANIYLENQSIEIF